MFTGIVEEIGEIQKVKTATVSSELTIRAEKVLENTNVGDSIMVNGVCLTVKNLGKNTFMADVMSETLSRTNLNTFSKGSPVNLERALTLQKPLGGHMVSGHIDDTGKITRFKNEDNAVWVTVQANTNILRYVIEKGSIAIDGISLTVAKVTQEDFQVSIIPHTAEETTLLKNNIGDLVNLECDLIGKYVEKLLKYSPESEPVQNHLTESFLQKNGFL
ncbi:riboflavin synthase [Marinilactibacillus piezotolerans]|uniref:riboflavin synthase n=1 Tax=Marinilactibacillus piezotolerans TaxID=258723 RepID=UPI0009B01318|nr:riboflavin synthase [Marinilactibacillus piezotolerans]